jgi:hypothetical protein
MSENNKPAPQPEPQPERKQEEIPTSPRPEVNRVRSIRRDSIDN